MSKVQIELERLLFVCIHLRRNRKQYNILRKLYFRLTINKEIEYLQLDEYENWGYVCDAA